MELYFCADSNTASPTDDKNLRCRLSADKSFFTFVGEEYCYICRLKDYATYY